MSLHQTLAILWARKSIILVVFIASIIISIVIVQLLPEQYRATSTVILDVGQPDAVTGQTMASGLIRFHIGTQIRLITSERVAGEVVDNLNLTQSPAFISEYLTEKRSNEDNIRRWISSELLENLDVRNLGVSRILAISYTSNSPVIAASIANAFTEAYIRVDLELRVDPSRRNARWFSGQLNNLRQSLTDSQQRLTEYQQLTGIVSVAQELDAENSKLADLTRRVTAARASASDARSIVEQLGTFDELRGSGSNFPEFLSSQEIDQRRSELTRIDAQMATILGAVGINHPEYKALVAGRRVIEQQLTREIEVLRQSIYAREKIALSKVASLERDLESQKQMLLRVREDRDQLDALVREVDIRKTEYDSAFRRASTLRLEGAMSHTGVSVMERALPPSDYSYPKKRQSVALSGGFSFVLGLALAFLFEMFDRRIRTGTDLELATSSPVLAQLRRVKRKRKSGKSKYAPAVGSIGEDGIDAGTVAAA